MRRASLWLPPLLYMLIIYYFSSQSDPLPVVTAHVWDKLLHLGEYAGLALLFCRALNGEGLNWLAAAVAGIALTSLYGVSDEWHQAYVPLRSVDLQDWIADVMGATVGATLGSLMKVGIKNS